MVWGLSVSWFFPYRVVFKSFPNLQGVEVVTGWWCRFFSNKTYSVLRRGKSFPQIWDAIWSYITWLKRASFREKKHTLFCLNKTCRLKLRFYMVLPHFNDPKVNFSADCTSCKRGLCCIAFHPWPLKKWQTNHLRIKSAIWRTIILSSFQFPFQFVIVLVRQSTEQLTQNSNHWVRHWLSHSQHRPGSVRTWCMQKSTQTKLGWFRKIPQYNAWGLYILHPFGGWTTNCFFHQRAIVPLIFRFFWR